MAKRKQDEALTPPAGNVQMRINKSAKIRQMLEEVGLDASPTEVAQKLTAQGLDVTPALVSQIKLALAGKSRKAGRARKAAPELKAPTKAAAKSGDGIPLEEVRRVKELTERLGAGPLKELLNLFGE